MSKIYNNSITTTAGFKYNAPQPLDDRLVVEKYIDLATLVSDGVTYQGMEVYVVEKQLTYKYLGASVWESQARIRAGTGTNSAILGEGIAVGNYSISGGTSNTNTISNLLRFATNKNPEATIANGDMSISIGTGAITHSVGDIAIGVNVIAGCKGFYFSALSGKVLTLSTSNTTTSWNEQAQAQLAQWQEGDTISLENAGTRYPLCSKITAITQNTTTSAKITLDTIPFTSRTSEGKFDSCCVINISKSDVGIVKFGPGAIALGVENEALGSLSYSLGRNNKVYGDYAFAIGNGHIVKGAAASAIGLQNKSLGNRAHAQGQHTFAIGQNSFAGGQSASSAYLQPDSYITEANWDSITTLKERFTATLGNNSFAYGFNNLVTTDSGIALGQFNKVSTSGVASGAFGYKNTVTAGQAFAIGHTNIVEKSRCIALGNNNTLTGGVEGRVAVGYYNDDTNKAIFAVGVGSSSTRKNALEVRSNGSFIIGTSNTASATDAIAMGQLNTVSGTQSFAAGYNNKILNASSGAIGHSNTIGESSGQCFAAGMSNNVSGYKCIALGKGLEISYDANNKAAYEEGRVVVGRYNAPTGSDIFVVGTGTSNSTAGRKNALSIGKDGNTTINGNLTVSGTITATNINGTTSGGETSIPDKLSITELNVTSGEQTNITDTGISTGGNLLVGTHDALGFIDMYGNSGVIGATTLVYSEGDITAVGDIYAGTSKVLVEGDLSNYYNKTDCDTKFALKNHTHSGYATTTHVHTWSDISNKPAIEIAANTSSISLGTSNTVNATSSIALGIDNVLKGARNGAWGQGNTIGSTRWVAEDAYALGRDNNVEGSQGFAAGFENDVQDHKCAAIGWGNIINYMNNTSYSDGRVVVGRFNVAEEAQNEPTGAIITSIFTVGIGSDTNNRKNGFEVHSDGKIKVDSAATINLEITYDDGTTDTYHLIKSEV